MRSSEPLARISTSSCLRHSTYSSVPANKARGTMILKSMVTSPGSSRTTALTLYSANWGLARTTALQPLECPKAPVFCRSLDRFENAFVWQMRTFSLTDCGSESDLRPTYPSVITVIQRDGNQIFKEAEILRRILIRLISFLIFDYGYNK
jgi:hypothetical protein